MAMVECFGFLRRRLEVDCSTLASDVHDGSVVADASGYVDVREANQSGQRAFCVLSMRMTLSRLRVLMFDSYPSLGASAFAVKIREYDDVVRFHR